MQNKWAYGLPICAPASQGWLLTLAALRPTNGYYLRCPPQDLQKSSRSAGPRKFPGRKAQLSHLQMTHTFPLLASPRGAESAWRGSAWTSSGWSWPCPGLTSHRPVLHLYPDFIISLKLHIDPLQGKEEKVLTTGQWRVPVHSPLPEPSGSTV